MKHTKQKEIPAKTVTFVESISCDICGEKIPTQGTGNFSEVEVSCKTGYRYPEGGVTTTRSVDMCEKCFRSKLEFWFVTQGAVIQSIESDY
jgi:hypothetical protein